MSVMPISADMPPSRTTTGWMLEGIRRVTMKQIGTSMRAMMLSTAPYVARRSGSSMALRRMKYAMMMSMRMRYVVRRGSHVHHTPHSNLVHKSPVIIVHATNSSAISIAIFEQVSKRRFFVMRKRTA